MTLELSPEHEAAINRLTARGGYSSPQEVLDHALQLLEEDELVHSFRLARLRHAIDVADGQAANGFVKQFDSEEVIRRIHANRLPQTTRSRRKSLTT